MALKMYFWDPHNEIKCVLSIIESYSIEKNGSKFSHLLTVRAEVADPPPYGQPDRKISAFYMTSLREGVNGKKRFLSGIARIT